MIIPSHLNICKKSPRKSTGVLRGLKYDKTYQCIYGYLTFFIFSADTNFFIGKIHWTNNIYVVMLGNGPSCLSETRRGWKFGLTPPPSLRSKAHNMIQEILPYIRARFVLKLDHDKFPIHINCLHTTLYLLPAITKNAFPTVVVLKISQMCTWVIFKILKMAATHCIFVGFTILKR